MYSADTLRKMKRICEMYDVLFIADEVMTAWGRNGGLFACDYADIVPDIACYSKGIIGGFLPLAVTLCHSRIFDAHYSTDRSNSFFHSSSYTANPIACTVAAANLEKWQEDKVEEQIRATAARQKQKLTEMAALESLTNLRQTGTIAAMDVQVSDSGYLSEIGTQLWSKIKSLHSQKVKFVVRKIDFLFQHITDSSLFT